MKRNALVSLSCLAFVLTATIASAQMYTITDLGVSGTAQAINESGQVVVNDQNGHAFRTAPNSAVNPATDDLGSLGGTTTFGADINASGQVVGSSLTVTGDPRAFRTAANAPINPDTDNLGTLFSGSSDEVTAYSGARAINDSGQVVGFSGNGLGDLVYGFRTAPNSPIDVIDDRLLSTWFNVANDINASGQVAGDYYQGPRGTFAFRTAPNTEINLPADDLGNFTGVPLAVDTITVPEGINDAGQVVGSSGDIPGPSHAFRTAPNQPINPHTDDLGTLGGAGSAGLGIDAYGQVVGAADTNAGTSHAFLSDGGRMRDLNNLIPAGSGWVLNEAKRINNVGQVIGNGELNGEIHPFLLTPIYNASVQAPINASGSSVFLAKRGILQVKFTLSRNSVATCRLPRAELSLTRTGITAASRGALGAVNPYSGFFFRSDPAACQYIINLSVPFLGIGQYRADISIDGIMVGHAGFRLQ